MSYQPPDPREIAARGIEIYNRKYRAGHESDPKKYENELRGRFAAIDINSERIYIADFPEEALAIAKAAAPHGVFYLLRIGSQAAFTTSRITHAHSRGI